MESIKIVAIKRIVTAACGRQSFPEAIQLNTIVHNGKMCEGCHFKRLRIDGQFVLISHNKNRRCTLGEGQAPTLEQSTE